MSIFAFIVPMSIFEVLMLICFASAWPLSILRSYTSRSNKGKSLPFLCAILAGYCFGSIYKWFANYDYVFGFYVANGVMVSVDILIYLWNMYIGRGGWQTP